MPDDQINGTGTIFANQETVLCELTHDTDVHRHYSFSVVCGSAWIHHAVPFYDGGLIINEADGLYAYLKRRGAPSGGAITQLCVRNFSTGIYPNASYELKRLSQ